MLIIDVTNNVDAVHNVSRSTVHQWRVQGGELNDHALTASINRERPLTDINNGF